jgi:hypothetical protein
MQVAEVTDIWVEAAAEELYHQAARGKSWHALDHDTKQQLRAITRQVIERGRVAEIAERSRRRGVLP